MGCVVQENVHNLMVTKFVEEQCVVAGNVSKSSAVAGCDIELT